MTSSSKGNLISFFLLNCNSKTYLDHYIVAGTKIYVDSRIDGAHITRESNPFEEDPPSVS